MNVLFFLLLAAFLGYTIGAMPLGALFIRFVSGATPASANPHLIGVENLYRVVGPLGAIGAFVLDIVKGAGAVVLAVQLLYTGIVSFPVLAGVAAAGVLIGHMFPYQLSGHYWALRGRGNGVVFGILAGLYAISLVPMWLPMIIMAAYGAVLAFSGFVVLASASGLVALLFGGLVGAWLGQIPSSLLPFFLLLTVLQVWRFKAALMRVQDGTEPRLGEERPMRGVGNADTVVAAFLVHPLTLADVAQPPSMQWLQRFDLNEETLPAWLVATLKRVTLHTRPQLHSIIDGVQTEDRRNLRVLLLSAPILPDVFRDHPERATEIAKKGARFAYELGAEVIGLGAFWSTVGNKGEDVQQAVPEIVVTNGGAYTAATVRAAIPGLLDRFSEAGGTLADSTVAIVGANGVVAFGVARLVARDVHKLILIGRDQDRLERSARSLRRQNPDTEIIATTEIAASAEADLVFAATSDPDPVLFSEHIKSGAWIYDLGRPADVAPEVLGRPDVEVVPGGIVTPPGQMQSNIDLHFGDGKVPACMAETMILAVTGSYDRRSLGSQTKSENIQFYLTEGEQLGFEIITRDPRYDEAA